jgi:hypothetical protein
MCMSKPDIKQPDPVQEVKQPDLNSVLRARKKKGGMAGGSLLTGPGGLDGGSVATGATTLLGG